MAIARIITHWSQDLILLTNFTFIVDFFGAKFALVNNFNVKKFTKMTKFLTQNYKYPKPINFDEDDSDFDIFKNLPDEICSEAEIEMLKNVRVANNSMIFTYFKIWKETCIDFRKYNDKTYRFFLKFIFPQFNFSKKKFVLITDEWTCNYYHWHAFALKKLLILLEKKLIDDQTIFLFPKSYKKYSFALESLKKFGLTKNKIVFLRRKSNIKVAELPLIKFPRQHPKIYQEIRKILIEKTPNFDSEFGERIYISREKRSFRIVENEAEVLTLLEKYGFKKIVAENFSYNEQIAIFSKAKYLVGPHGAGLTNAMFLKEGGALLEIATAQNSQNFNKDFYALSTMVGINYLHQKCEIDSKNSKIKDFYHGIISVNLEKLEKNLKLMLGQ